MLPGRGILGALLRSRCDYGSKPPRNGTGKDKMHRERKGPRTGDEAAVGDDDDNDDRPGTATATATATAAMRTPAMATKSALGRARQRFLHVQRQIGARFPHSPGPEQASFLRKMVVDEPNDSKEAGELPEWPARPPRPESIRCGSWRA